jgi:hypothetical protein
MKRTFVLLLIFFTAITSRAALTWHWAWLPSDMNASNSIAAAMNQAVAVFNTYSDYNYDIAAAYNSGVPTAQSDFHGTIQFGGSISYRVAMHEMSHWLGTGTTGNWATYAHGSWEGGYANSAQEVYDGPYATLGCDGAHYWPYGWNYDNEAVYPERHIGLIGAFVRDQGLDEDRTIGFSPGSYCLRNRGSFELLDNFGSLTDGAQVKQWGYSGNPNQQWVLSLIPGTTLFTLRSVASGKFLDSLGKTADGAPVGQVSENFTPSQQWQVVKTDAGYYKIINMANGKCLDTAGQTTDGTGMQSWSSNGSRNQQWKFINTTLAGIPAGLLSQYRPVAASSSQAGYSPEPANDGKTFATRWTANGGAYPQWWRVDLGSICNVTNATLSWFPGVAFQYRIEISPDDVNHTVALDATANAVQNTTTDTLSVAARYVRVTVTGVTPSGGWAAFYECQVYGRPQISAAPAGLAATPASSSQINLSWGDQANVSSYNVKRSTSTGGPYTTIAPGVKGIGYSDIGLAGSTTYYYVVTAVNAGGESANSLQASAATPAPALPVAPTGLTAMPGHNQVVLSWASSSEAAARLFDFGTGTSSYMFLAPASGGNTLRYAITTGGGEQQINGPALSAGTWHHVAVTLSGTTGTLYVDGLAAGSNNSMTLKPSSLGSTTQNYIGKSQFPDPLLNGRVDDFRIYNRALSNAEISMLFSASGVVPVAPTGLAANPGNSQVTLNWNASAGSTGYKVKRAATSAGPYTTITNVFPTAFIDAVVANGTTYYYVVSAVNLSGESVNSTPVGATPSSTARVNLAMSLSAGALNLTWPGDHTGWRLQVQTNAPSLGLGTNWMDVPGSSLTNNLVIPVDPTQGSVFYRLVY